MSVPGHKLDKMFNPKTVVVVGDKGPGYTWLKNNMPVKEKGGNLGKCLQSESRAWRSHLDSLVQDRGPEPADRHA